jgi:hypothetical protein
MWRPNEPVEDDVSDLPGIDPHSKRRRSRRRAWHDGFADQTVIRNLEDVRAYRAFERALVGSVDPRSMIELALVETGLFELQGEFLLARGQGPSGGPNQPGVLSTSSRANGYGKASGSNGRYHPPAGDQEPLSTSMRPPHALRSKSRAIAQCFLRVSHFDPTLLDAVGRYEARLWRQAAQTIWTLDAMRRPPPAPARRPFRKPVVLSYWDAEHSRVR